MNKTQIALLAVMVLGTLVFAIYQSPLPNPAPEAAASVAPSPISKMIPENVSTTEFAKKLATTTTYMSPAGEESVGFILYVDDQGEIVDAQTDMMGKDPTSQFRQTSFAGEFPAAVKGKKLAELTSIDRVGGSSLTTGAFNQALAGLKAQL